MESGESYYLQGTDLKLSRAHTRDSPLSSVLMSGSIVIFKLLGETEWGKFYLNSRSSYPPGTPYMRPDGWGNAQATFFAGVHNQPLAPCRPPSLPVFPVLKLQVSLRLTLLSDILDSLRFSPTLASSFIRGMPNAPQTTHYAPSSNCDDLDLEGLLVSSSVRERTPSSRSLCSSFISFLRGNLFCLSVAISMILAGAVSIGAIRSPRDAAKYEHLQMPRDIGSEWCH